MTFKGKLSNAVTTTTVNRYSGSPDQYGIRQIHKQVTETTKHIGLPSDDELLRAWAHFSDAEIRRLIEDPEIGGASVTHIRRLVLELREERKTNAPRDVY